MNNGKKVRPGIVELPWTRPATSDELEALEAPQPAVEAPRLVSGAASPTSVDTQKDGSSGRFAGVRPTKPRQRGAENSPLVSFSVRIQQSLVDRVYEISHRRRRAHAAREQTIIQNIVAEALSAGLDTLN